MKLGNGSILVSTKLLNNTFFEKAVLLIVEHNKNGATGFVINQPFERKLNQLEEFKKLKPTTLFTGGPMDNEHIYFVHQKADIIKDGVPIGENIYWGGNFKQALQHLNYGKNADTDVRLFLGYCGWDKGQLEEEIAEGSWQLSNISLNMVFNLPITTLWDALQSSLASTIFNPN